jgi:hypothetical protein
MVQREHDDIDREIDAAARGLTAGEPRGDLSARVAAAVDRRATYRPRPMRWLRIAVPSAAAISLVLTILHVYDEPRATVPVPNPRSVVDATPRGGPPVPPSDRREAIGARTRLPAIGSRVQRESEVQNGAGLENADAMGFSALTVEPIQVEPLAIENTPTLDVIAVEDVSVPSIEIDQLVQNEPAQ